MSLRASILGTSSPPIVRSNFEKFEANHGVFFSKWLAITAISSGSFRGFVWYRPSMYSGLFFKVQKLKIWKHNLQVRFWTPPFSQICKVHAWYRRFCGLSYILYKPSSSYSSFWVSSWSSCANCDPFYIFEHSDSFDFPALRVHRRSVPYGSNQDWLMDQFHKEHHN